MFKYEPSPEAVISLQVRGNPKRPGTMSYARFGFYRDGMTVDEYFVAGGTLGDIYYDIGRGYIAGSDYPHGRQRPCRQSRRG